MLSGVDFDKRDVVSPEGIAFDLSQLLGFRDLVGVGSGEAEIAAALDAAHVKIGEVPPPLTQAS